MKIEVTTPGPSPWYLRGARARLNTRKGSWIWEIYDGPTLSGLSRLLSPEGETVLFVDFNCYVQPLSGGCLIGWYEMGRRVIFTILDLDTLIPLREHLKIAAEIRSKKSRIWFHGGEARIYEVSTALGEGTHSIFPPAEFADLPELLVLADFGPGEDVSNHWDKMYRAIFAFDFKSRQVTVLPQKWFNGGKYDFGYQWITRVQRDPITGQIVGEGIRLGNFLLDRSGTQVQEWLHEDIFYHPER